MNMPTPKEIAQTYVLNDIVIHELILEAFKKIEAYITVTNKKLTKYDIVSKICKIIEEDELYKVFEISKPEVLNVLRHDYQIEIESILVLLEK